MHWDLFCRVIDNYGDVGVAWRLASDLAARGQEVRLVLDDASALGWMAPQRPPRVEILSWEQGALLEPAEVVIEAFGCDPPPQFVQRMARRAPAPLWLNLEYLSAEPYVERSHGLPSPQASGPGQGLLKWFYFPGFTPASGGLLREPGLLQQRHDFDPAPWLAAQGIVPLPGERLVSLFCYPGAALDQLSPLLADQPTLLLLTPGAAQQALSRLSVSHGLRLHALPWLSQADYDRLLWSCDMNFVRGEDSLVRACWAGNPFVWQPYAQHDGAHGAKLQALADRLGAEQIPGLASLWRRWSRLEPGALALPPLDLWRGACLAWRQHLAEQPDLVTQLLGFAERKIASSC